MSNYKYLAEFGNLYNTILRLTDTLEEATDFLKTKAFAAAVDKKPWNPWGSSDVASSRIRKLLLDQHPEIAAGSGAKAIDLKYRASGSPVFEVPHPLTIEAWLERRAKQKAGASTWSIDNETRWSCRIPIEARVAFSMMRGEIKVPGQPYQPAQETKVEGEWHPIYDLGNNKSNLSADERPTLKQSGFEHPVIPKEWRGAPRMSGKEEAEFDASKTNEPWLETISNGRIRIVEVG